MASSTTSSEHNNKRAAEQQTKAAHGKGRGFDVSAIRSVFGMSEIVTGSVRAPYIEALRCHMTTVYAQWIRRAYVEDSRDQRAAKIAAVGGPRYVNSIVACRPVYTYTHGSIHCIRDTVI